MFSQKISACSRWRPRLLLALFCSALILPAWAADNDADDDDGDGDGVEMQSPFEPEAATDAQGQVVAPVAKNLPAQELTPKIMFQLLLAEIAGNRGNLSLASKEYLDLARTTRDPRIARRATEFAFYSRQFDDALNAARIWVEADPESAQARQMLVGLLAMAGRPEEISAHLAFLLAHSDQKVQGAELLRLMRIFEQTGDKLTTLRVINQVTEPYLTLPEAHFVRAQAAAQTGDFAAALSAIDKALKLRPEWEAAVLFKAALLQKEPAKQLAALRDYVENYPMQAKDARVAYARALVVDKQYDVALKHFRIALEQMPDRNDLLYAVGLLAMQAGEYDLAEKCLKRLIEKGHAESNMLRLYVAQIAEDDKRIDEALKWYDSVEAGEQYPQAQLRAARMLLKNGRQDEAREHLRKALKDDPKAQVSLALAEAQMLRDGNRAADALAVLSKALDADPDNLELLYETALTAERLDKLDLMEKNLRRLIALKPDYAQAYNALGYSLADRGLRLDEAGKLIDKALSLTPEDPFILDSKGWVLFRKGDKAAALDMLRHAYEKRPDPEIAAHIGEVLWSLDRRDEAKKLWSEALKKDPDNQPLRDVIKRLDP